MRIPVAIQGYFGFGTYCLGLVGLVFVASSVCGVAQSVHLGGGKHLNPGGLQHFSWLTS